MSHAENSGINFNSNKSLSGINNNTGSTTAGVTSVGGSGSSRSNGLFHSDNNNTHFFS